MSIKTSLIALTTMAAIGVAAPATVELYYQYDIRPRQAHTDLAPDLEIALPTPTVERISAVDVDEVVITLAPARRMPPAQAVEEAEMTCRWHQSQTLASSKVRVCDIERTKTGRSDQLLAPHDLPKQMIVERDTPSPSGLLDGS